MMYPSPSPPTTTTTVTEPLHYHSLPPLPTSKIHLMCSYTGHIVPSPETKSLCHVGRETRIVVVDRQITAATISALTHHLSHILYDNRPFDLKYQLPNEDLDSLILIRTDEDLQNMLEEHNRIVSSPTPTRIRLLMFPTRPEFVGSLLLDPKSESWFSDALKSAVTINRGCLMGNGLSDRDVDTLYVDATRFGSTRLGSAQYRRHDIPPSCALEFDTRSSKSRKLSSP